MALESLAAFLEEGLSGVAAFGGALGPLQARILQVAAASPLLQWAMQPPAPPPAPAEQQQQPQPVPPDDEGGPEASLTPPEAQQQQRQGLAGEEGESVELSLNPPEAQQPDGMAVDFGESVELSLTPPEGLAQPQAPEPEADPLARSLRQLPPLRSPSKSPSKPRLGEGPVDDGPHAAAAAACSRSAALHQLLLELQVEAQLSGSPERRRVAVVAGTAASAAALRQLLADAPQLAGMEVCLLRDAPETPPEPEPMAANGGADSGSDGGSQPGSPSRALSGAYEAAAAAACEALEAAELEPEGSAATIDSAAANAAGPPAAAQVALGAGLEVHVVEVSAPACLCLACACAWPCV